MKTGRRAWQCELSTVDSAFLLAGALTSAAYFEADAAGECGSALSLTRSIIARIGRGLKTAGRV